MEDRRRPSTSASDAVDAALQRLPDFVYRIGPDFRHLFAAGGVKRITGRDPADFIGKTGLELGVPPDVYAKFEALCREVLATGEPRELETHVGDLWLHDRLIPEFGPDGRVGSILGVSQDVTARKRAELALAEERIFTNAVVDSVPGLLYLYSEDGRLVRWNKRHEEQMGYSPEELRGMYVLDWMGGREPHTTNVARAFRQVFEKGSVDIEAEILTKDGRAIPFLFTGVKLTIAGVNYVTGIGIDMTDRNRARDELAAINATLEKLVAERTQALRESEARYRAVVEDQTDLISRFAVDGTLLFVNEPACRFFGRTRDEMVGRKWQPNAVPEDLPMVLEQLATMTPDNPVVTIENRVYAPTGRVHWMQFVNRGLYDADGRLMEIQSVARDVTARKLAEQQLIEQRRQLELLGAAVARAHEDERRRIAAGLHDHVGQTLAASQMRLGAAREAKKAEDRDRLMDEAMRLMTQAAQDIRELTFELRGPTVSDVGFAAAVRELCDHMQRRFGLDCEFDDTQAGGDVPLPLRGALYHGVRELLLNVVKHSGATRATIRVARDLTSLRVSVEDNGRGLDAAEPGLSVSREGGFGLYHLRQRLADLSGTLEFGNVPAGGTIATMRVSLG